MLELSDVVSLCTAFLKQELHSSNAVGIYRFSDGHHCIELKNAAINFIQSHFPLISEEEEFYELPKDQLVKFLSSEHLRVDSEFQVSYISHKPLLLHLLSTIFSFDSVMILLCVSLTWYLLWISGFSSCNEMDKSQCQ